MRCAEGHVWRARAVDVAAGHWCAICRRTGRPPEYTITDVQQAAAKRGGKLLSKRYRRVDERLTFECSAGHRFRTKAARLLNEGRWCKQCAVEKQRLGLDCARATAARRGGLCLSTSYLNNQQPLDWECAKGHRWRAMLSNVRRGTWCPLCNRPRRLTIEDAQEAARARGGRCISRHFRNSTTHLWWECATGHQWRATPKNVRQHGTWCPECARGMSAREVQARRKASRPLAQAARALVRRRDSRPLRR